MVENARRQIIFIALLVSGAILLLAFGETNLGLDLRGGTQLVYEVDLEAAQRAGDIPADADPGKVMQETADIVYKRIDPTGVMDANVARRGSNGFIVELPGLAEAEALAVQQRIETLGRLEMRVLATPDYRERGASFDLEAEKRQVREWLDKEGNRDRVRAEPLAINLYNNPRPHLHWLPALIRTKASDATKWDRGYSDPEGVAVFDPAELTTPPKTKEAFLVELLPINWIEDHFTGSQMDPSGVYAGNDPSTGKPAVFYAFKGQFQDAYADWSSKYIQKRSAIILNGIVESAPTFQSRIPGSGIITMGNGTVDHAAELAKVLKTGSLQVRPELQQRTAIGASLGEVAIFRGGLSMALGAAAVVIFMLAYYRTAGLVAVIGLAMNVLLLMAAMIGMRATLTLPGIAGLVLTLGMAVDSNILIYERIREELNRGKAIVQAVRAGFDRALLTILDANITTFLAGLVLYHIGVGPIRGFAVTLMVGIVTSVFTAYFVSRLIYHYLLEKEKLKGFRVTTWFADIAVDWVKKCKVVATASGLLIVVLMANFFVTPSDVSMGLEFTGGANLQVVLRQPVTKAELRAKLAAHPEFHAEFPDPQILNVRGVDAEGRSDEFAVKLKLRTAYAEKVRNDRHAASLRGEAYEPPYLKQFSAILADNLVERAFDSEQVVEDPNSSTTAIGMINLHFTEPVKVEDIRLETAKVFRVKDVHVVGDPSATAGKTVQVAIDVPVETKANSLLGMLARPLGNLKNSQGGRIQLSSPFPEASEIGGRMVGELQASAIGAMLLSWLLIGLYVRVRFHEYKFGIAAVVAVIHDILVTFGFVVLMNRLGLVAAEVDMPMIAALLTVVGYSINDSIVVFDRVRENLADQARLGTKETFAELVNRAINQTFSRTVLTTGTTVITVLAMFLVTRGTGSSLEGFSFALVIGVAAGSYSTIFIATPILLWMKAREKPPAAAPAVVTEPQPA